VIKRLAVLTSGRQDWGILRSTCLLLRDDPRFDLRLLVAGMHCAPAFGRTETLIRDDGFDISERLDWIADAETPASQAGAAVTMVSMALQRQQADALLLIGDRFETLAAALASTLERVPIVHVHGGEETAGAIDDMLRNAITKLSHLHLVSHPDHARRLIASGEDRDAIHVVGAPGLDNLYRTDLPTRSELGEYLGLALEPPVVLVTVNPATLAAGTASETDDVIGVMDHVEATYVVTLPNTDPGYESIRDRLLAATAGRRRRVAVAALGDRRYWALLRIADAMLGNSSSALIEAPAVGLPAINVGDRQLGRIRGDNVIDVPAGDVGAIAAALREALRSGSRRRLTGVSPFGDGRSAQRIVEILSGWTPPQPPRKPPIPLAEIAV
jgi:UDP-hydrolysing UDP-N-acetyl-D-glucosamine 2-epimerase